jgi:hypothetical protein
MSANETQVGGDHYKSKAIQPWDYIASNNLGYLEGCIIKYISRHRDKGGLEDLQKAQHFLAKLIEIEADQAIKTTGVSRGELLKEILPGLNELFGMEYEKYQQAITPQAELNKLEEKAYKASKKMVMEFTEPPVKRGRGRPRKAPYGLKANGQPYVRRPRGFKEEQQ